MVHARILERIRGEYLEMPGLQLTLGQAQRLCGVEKTLCQAVLDALVDARFLVITPTGTYRRATDGEPRRHARVTRSSPRSSIKAAS